MTVIELRRAAPDDIDWLWSVQWRARGSYVTDVFGRSEAEQRTWFTARRGWAGR